MKEDGFTIQKSRSRRYHAQMNVDHTNNVALVANKPTQAKSLLHNLEKVACGIGLYVHASKTEDMCFNQKGDISTLKCDSQKLVEFSYFGGSVSST